MITEIVSIISIVVVAGMTGFFYYKNLELKELSDKIHEKDLEIKDLKKRVEDALEKIDNIYSSFRSPKQSIIEKYF